MADLDLSRVPTPFHRYIAQVTEPHLLPAFEQYLQDLLPLLQSLPADKWDFRYAPGKWTIKEMVQHLIDADRIFMYRALCIARQDKTPLPGFEEDDYARASEANRRTPESLLEELATVQKSAVLLFRSFSEEQLNQSGI